MNILFYFPWNIFKYYSGTSQRVLQILSGLVELGHCVTLWSLKSWFNSIWDDESILLAKKKYHINTILTFNWTGAWQDEVWDYYQYKYFYENQDLLITTYYHNIPIFHDCPLPIICDTHDLISIAQNIDLYLREKIAIKSKFGKLTKYDFRLEDLFINNDLYFKISQEEVEAYKKCKKVITIKESDQNLLTIHKIDTVNIPYVPPEVPSSNLTTNAIFLASNNSANAHATAYLAKLVIPEIFKQQKNIPIDIIGAVNNFCIKYPYLNFLGIQPASQYQNAQMGLCPIIYGTGQKIKIIEYMSRAIPVIMLKYQVDGIPIINEENGLICQDYKDFTENIIRLHQDKNLSIKLGRLGKETIDAFYNKDNFLNDLQMTIS